MISALPLLLAQRLAAEVDRVAGGALFTAPCRAIVGDPVFAGTGAQSSGVFVKLLSLEHEAAIGVRAGGESIRLPFEAEVEIALAGPRAPDLAGVERVPDGVDVDGRDMILALAMDMLSRAGDAGRNDPMAQASVVTNGRRLAAEWRFGAITSVASEVVSTRSVWRITAQFTGVQTLSPEPGDGGPILHADIAGVFPDRQFDATLEASSDRLPLSIFVGIGPENANRLAAFNLVLTRDLLALPLLPLVRVQDRTRLTLGQLSTFDAGG